MRIGFPFKKNISPEGRNIEYECLPISILPETGPISNGVYERVLILIGPKVGFLIPAPLNTVHIRGFERSGGQFNSQTNLWMLGVAEEGTMVNGGVEEG